jgi:NADH-quinone oxidoreductase subunit D
VSDGGETPYRVKIRAPSFSNLYALTEMMKGWKIADVIAILGSIDIVLSDVDR